MTKYRWSVGPPTEGRRVKERGREWLCVPVPEGEKEREGRKEWGRARLGEIDGWEVS